MRRLLLVALALLAVLVAYRALAVGERDGSWETVLERGRLRVGMDASFPPFEVVEADGQVRGLDVDLANLVAQRLGLSLEIANIAFDGLYDGLASGEVDVIISALPYEAQRTRDVRYSAPYFVDGLVWVGDGEPKEPGTDYAGPVLVEAGSEAAMLARYRHPEAAVLEVLSEEEVLAGLESVGGFGIVGRLSACGIEPGSGLTPGAPLTESPYVVAVRARATELADVIMSTLEEVLASDDWTTIRHRWLGEAC